MNNLIKKIVDIATVKKEGHIPSSLSILDIMYVLYDKVLDINSIKENRIDRDRFILSKGHASLGLYVILDHFKLLKDDINTFCDLDSKLGGHPTDKIFGVESSTGSLGHGLPIGIGLALASKIKKYKNKVYVIVGDGEANEGTIWESALLAKHHNLDNLCCIIDFNHSTDRAVDLGNLHRKFSSFGWDVIDCDGHDHPSIEAALKYPTVNPTCIIANTIKGKGIPMIENNPEWHHKFPNEEEYQQIIDNLNEYKMETLNHGDEVEALITSIKKTKNIPGEIIEVGVYQGGSAKVIYDNMGDDKKLFLCDTFEGLKDSTEDDDCWIKNGDYTADFDMVQESFPDKERVKLIKGYFPDSATEEIKELNFSFAHLDVDTYTSTLNSLEFLYPRMSKGGIIISHDYNSIPAVTRAIDEFFSNKPETVNTPTGTQMMIEKL